MNDLDLCFNAWESIAKVKGIGELFGRNITMKALPICLPEKDLEVPTLRDYALIRTKFGALCPPLSFLVQEGAILPLKQDALLIRNSPLLELMSKGINQKERSEREVWNEKDKGIGPFYIDSKKFYQQAEEDKNKEPEEKRALKVKKKEGISIPTKRFGEEELTRWAYRDQAERFGEFLHEYGFKKLDFEFHNLSDERDNPVSPVNNGPGLENSLLVPVSHYAHSEISPHKSFTCRMIAEVLHPRVGPSCYFYGISRKNCSHTDYTSLSKKANSVLRTLRAVEDGKKSNKSLHKVLEDLESLGF